MTVPSARSQSEMYFARMTLTQSEKRKIFLKMFSISKNSSLSTKLSGTWKKSDLLLSMKDMDYKLLSSMDSKKNPVNYILNTDYMLVGVHCLSVN